MVRGQARVRLPERSLELADRSHLHWESQDQGAVKPGQLPALPPWWVKPTDPKAPEVQKARRSLLDWSQRLGGSNIEPSQKKNPKESMGVVPAIKAQVEEEEDPDNQDVGILFLGALGEIEPLLSLQKDRRYANIRGVTIFALQAWLGRDPSHAGQLAELLARREGGRPVADRIVRWLHFLPREAVRQRKTFEELIACLEDDNLVVRDLGFWHLDRLGLGGLLPEEARSISYDPSGKPEERKAAVEKWKKLLADGKVPKLVN
jgi:hypothetical protein